MCMNSVVIIHTYIYYDNKDKRHLSITIVIINDKY